MDKKKPLGWLGVWPQKYNIFLIFIFFGKEQFDNTLESIQSIKL